MNRIWQRAWDRYGSRYSWALWLILFVIALPVWLIMTMALVAVEGSGHYLEAAIATAVAILIGSYLVLPAGLGGMRPAEQWAAGRAVDPVQALEGTYAYTRAAVVRGVTGNAVLTGLLFLFVGAITDATGPRVVQYAVIGVVIGPVLCFIAIHSMVETAMRPVRVALSGEGIVGDSLPRSRPTFAAWSNVSILATAFCFAVFGAMLATVFNRSDEFPVLWLAIGCGLTLGLALPVTVTAAFSPSMQPIRDLAAGTERVAAGDYSQRLPVVQDDDLGALTASFNRMQAGLAERQRLQGAFGTYVDPVLAARLLEQGDDVFTGERREVTVMFVDIRDFTPFAESNSAEDTVARLNALFDIVVPAVVDAGGHVNKFLGDGALAVFGAPNDLSDHADAAVEAATVIQRQVDERFGGELRIGIGINTGLVIAGTIGGGSKLEFTLIGDTVNVAARVEQLTKSTGDTVLVTQQTVDALAASPAELVDRGAHVVKGKSTPVPIFGLA